MSEGKRNLLRRQGVASVLAMLFLVLFSVLALGFYSVVTTSVRIASADRQVTQSMLAAESGMELVRYHLSLLEIPSSTADSALIDTVYPSLQTQLNGTTNMGGATIGKSDGVISIPSSSTASVSLGGSSKFRATISKADNPANELIVTVIGLHGTSSITRKIQMNCNPVNEVSPYFDYAMASAGTILMKKGSVTDSTAGKANILSTSSNATAINITGGTIEGDLSVSTTKNAVNITGGSVGGTSSISSILNDHTFVTSPAPPMPVVSTTPFAAFATNTWTSSMNSPFKNIRIPPNSDPEFKQDDVIEGILYVQSPNDVIFKGHVVINGIIVFENAGTDANNTMEFKSSADMQPLPSGSEFDALRAVTGIGILAPTTAVSMKGTAATDIDGNVIVSKFSYKASASVTINNGSFVSLSTASDAVDLDGGTMSFNNTGSANPPSLGVAGSKWYVPKPTTYLEVP